MIAVAGPRTQARTLLVVAGNQDTHASVLAQTQAQGFSVISASDPAVGSTTFEMARPDIVLTDLFPPGKEGLALVRMVRERRPTCPVVILTEAGQVESVVEGLRAGALDYVQQPVHEEELAHVLQRAIQSLPTTVEDAPGIEQLEYRLVMGLDPSHVDSTVSWLIQGTAMGLPEARQLHLRAALQELVMNAVEHGSLELRYHDKLEAVAQDRYDELIRRRRQEARFKNRRVTIRAIYNKTQEVLQYRIADEGKGFNWKARTGAHLEACSTGDGSGRGLFLAHSFFPDIAYNERGNEVTLTVPLT